jgi:hypothetical protein
VIGFRDGIPSNSTGVRISDRGWCQSEIYGIPFTADVAPNWTKWSSAARADAAAFEQRRKYDSYTGTMYTLLGKTLYQSIKAPPAGASHGVWRKFLGLTPGHTYRLTAGLSTLKMDSVKSDWSLSVCAAPNRTGGKELTVQQMAGLAALPDGSKGPNAGRVASYGPRNTTRGIWEVVLSGHKAGRKLAGTHITLPPGVDTITMWVRFSCSDPNGQVAFSGVTLEDISAMGIVKTPEEVIQKERKEQALFRDGEAWIKEKAATR